MVIRYIGLICIVFLFNQSYAQSWEFSELKLLSELVNSPYEEIQPVICGDKLYFSRAMAPENKGGKFAGSDIWFWKIGSDVPASNLKSVNTTGQESIANFSKDGSVLYTSRFNPYKTIEGLYQYIRSGEDWKRDVLLKVPGIKSTRFFGSYITPEGDVMILSMDAPDSRGEEDLYISHKLASGEWTEPKNLGPTINTSGFEFGPFLSADRKYLFFASNGHPGLGDADIFVSERLYDTWETWSTPRNLGGDINSGAFDGYFVLYNSQFYFSSSRFGNSSDLLTGTARFISTDNKIDQKVLSSQQVTALIGNNVSTRFIFEQDVLTLNLVQQELLWYIVSKVIPKEKLNIRLNIVEDNNPTLSNIRLKTMIDFIKSTGIEGARIQFPESAVSLKQGQQMVIELQFYESL